MNNISTDKDKTIDSDQSTGKSVKNIRKTKLASIVVLMAVVAAIAGAILLVSKDDEENFVRTPNPAGINDNNVKLLGETELGGITLAKPGDLIAVSGEGTSSQQGYVQLGEGTDGKTLVNVSRLKLSTTKYSPLSENDLAEYKRVIEMDVTTKEFGDTFGSLIVFTTLAFKEPSIQVKLGNAAVFTTQTIRSNAWQFDVTTHDTKGLTPDHSGKLVLVLGREANYKILYTKTTTEWNAKPSEWQKVLASIRVDQ